VRVPRSDRSKSREATSVTEFNLLASIWAGERVRNECLVQAFRFPAFDCGQYDL
jgi:hypothetical protein